jgi:hypothetical protein
MPPFGRRTDRNDLKNAIAHTASIRALPRYCSILRIGSERNRLTAASAAPESALSRFKSPSWFLMKKPPCGDFLSRAHKNRAIPRFARFSLGKEKGRHPFRVRPFSLPRGGLEPPHLAALEPESSVSANFTIWAGRKKVASGRPDVKWAQDRPNSRAVPEKPRGVVPINAPSCPPGAFA